jgi:delta14-sterol reductase
MDITTDGFGWMLAFGDLAWVPFTYSTQSRFLVDHPVKLAPWGVLLVLGVKALGFWIFRGSNGQKNDFRTDPTAPAVKDLKFIQTHTGSKLLISGWWGYARHMNYFGDLLMGLSWCLPCGVGSIVPYFYFVYFAGLLGHRERRDEEKCHKKYGADWEKYCSIVPYRIVPYVY